VKELADNTDRPTALRLGLPRDRVVLPGLKLDLTLPGTLEFWLYNRELKGGGEIPITLTGPNQTLYLQFHDQNAFQVVIVPKLLAPDQASACKLLQYRDLPPGPIHLAVCWSPQGDYRLFVNGRPGGKLMDYTQAFPAEYLKQSVLGDQLSPETARNDSPMTVGEVRVSKGVRYDKDFSPVARHTPDKDTLALYHCDEGQGDKLTDSSGNNRHGKITGAKWVRGVPPVLTSEQAKQQQTAATKALGVPVQIENSINMKLNLIPAGRFVMGSPANEPGRRDIEGPRYEVAISKPYYLGAHEVTVGQFRAFVEATKREMKKGGVTGAGLQPQANLHWLDPGWVQEDTHPATCVTWVDAVAFCEWLSVEEKKRYRLPTEAEWEYACRAGSESRFFFGDDDRLLDEYANHGDISGGKPRPVGLLKPNPWGLFDIYGNVWEWCSDRFDGKGYSGEAATDPQGPEQGANRMIRGGGWTSLGRGGFVRSAYRYDYNATPPEWRFNGVGFRVVCELRTDSAGAEPKK